MDFVTNSFRFSEDQCNVVDCLLSQNQKSVYLIKVHNDQVAFGQTNAGRTVDPPVRITIADGYRSYAPADGYLNPRVEQIESHTLVLANGQLSTNQVMIGALVLPYNYMGFVGGLDPLATFQPPAGVHNLQIYLQIFGLGLPDTANFFKIKEIMLTGKDIQEGISYKIVAEAAGINVQLT